MGMGQSWMGIRATDGIRMESRIGSGMGGRNGGKDGVRNGDGTKLDGDWGQGWDKDGVRDRIRDGGQGWDKSGDGDWGQEWGKDGVEDWDRVRMGIGARGGIRMGSGMG